MIVKQTIAEETIEMLMERLHSNRDQLNIGKKGFKKLKLITIHDEPVEAPEPVISSDFFNGVRSF